MSDHMSCGVELRQVTKRYGDASSPLVVQGIDLKIQKGTLTTLLGPSGCGKTTTLRIMAGLEVPTSGHIFIDGRDVTALGPSQRDVSMVFQSYALYPNMTVGQNIAFGLEIRKVPKPEREAAVQRVATMLQIGHLLDRKPGQLSGGQRQRLAIARALITQPEVLVLDEPTSALDVSIQRQILELLQHLQKNRSLTYVLITHDLAVVRAMAHRVLVLRHGQVVEQGDAAEVLDRPRDAYTVSLIRAALEGT